MLSLKDVYTELTREIDLRNNHLKLLTDAGDIHKENKLLNFLQKMIKGNSKVVGDYIPTFIKNRTADRARVSTGILDLDKQLSGGLVDELYILGAQTSLGKSAIALAMAQNIAEQGFNVLYFALEMSIDEIIARGIASISNEHYLQDPSQKRFTTSDILNYRYDNSIRDFVKIPFAAYEKYTYEYQSRFGNNLMIEYRDIDSGTDAKYIANFCARIKKMTGSFPVVFIDYLQLIDPDRSDHAQIDKRNTISTAVTTFKGLASQIGMPVLLISSVNRQGYGKSVALDSYKESGEIEYTGGVVIGLNWLGVSDEENEEKRKAEVEACKERGYRRMALSVLKNRNGERDAQALIKYYPAYNYIEPDTGNDLPDKDVNPFTDKSTDGRRDIFY